MLLEGKVGTQNLGDGSVTPVRTGRLGELVTASAVGKYYELARRGQIFSAAFFRQPLLSERRLLFLQLL